MTRIRGVLRGLAAAAAATAAAAAAAVSLTADDQSVSAGPEPIAVGGDQPPASDPNVESRNEGSPEPGGTFESHETYGGYSSVLSFGESSGQEKHGGADIGRRLTAESEQGGSLEVLPIKHDKDNDDVWFEFDDNYASRGMCKQQEERLGDSQWSAAADVCKRGSPEDAQQCVHEDGREQATRGGVRGAPGELLPLGKDNATIPDPHSQTFSRESDTFKQQQGTPSTVGITESSNSSMTPGYQAEQHASELRYDLWEGYQVLAEADPVTSWEILREAHLSYYTFKYDQRHGRRQLGVLPTRMATLLPEAFSTFALPVLLPDGSRSRVEGVPTIDWTFLFAHTVVVTQELKRRQDTLGTRMDDLKAEAKKASLKLVQYMEEQGEDWQPSAELRELAALSELRRDMVKGKIMFEKAAGQQRRSWLEAKHNQSLALAMMDLELARTLAEEATSLAVQNSQHEGQEREKLEKLEESLRMSTEVAILEVDREAASQTLKLSSDRRLSESLATLRASKDAEREGEEMDMARIRAKGSEARKQTQAVVDEMFAFVGAMLLSIVSNPTTLARILAALLGMIFAGLFVGNSVALAATAVRRMATKPRLVRETDLPGSPLATVAAWIVQGGRALLMPLVGKFVSSTCGLSPASPEAFQGIVLPPNVEQRVRSLATSIRSSYNHGSPLPHVLIHGAPGSGKSVLARRFAKLCGLNTVVVAGGDVGCLGRSASSELSGLLRWAGGGGGGGAHTYCGVGGSRTSRTRARKRGRGVVVVVDEAEAAMGDRRKRGVSENARSALNAVLLCTGEPRPGFLMVLTTSRPQDLDEAVLDRVDEVIELPRPRLPERARLIRQYFSTYLHDDPPVDFLREPAAAASVAEGKCGGGQAVEVVKEHKNSIGNICYDHNGGGVVTRKGRGKGGGRGGGGIIRMSESFREKASRLMAMLAVRTEGFYGRDMAHLFSAVQAAVFGSESCELSEALWARTECQKLKEFSEKASMTAEPAAITNLARVLGVSEGKTTLLQEPPFTTAITTTILNAAGGAPDNSERAKIEEGKKRSERRLDIPSPLPSMMTNRGSTRSAITTTAGGGSTEATRRCRSSAFGSDLKGGGGGGGTTPSRTGRSSEKDRTTKRETSHDRKENDTAVEETVDVADSPPRKHKPMSACAESRFMGGELELEVETVGWEGALSSSPPDPEVTHPERVTD